MLGWAFHYKEAPVKKHDLGLFAILKVVFVTKLEFPFGPEADGTYNWILAKFFLIVAVPSYPVLAIPIIVDEDWIESGLSDGFDGLFNFQ